MANRFRQYVITFEAVNPGRITGSSILSQLSGLIDTDSADVEVDEGHVSIRFVSTLTEDQIWYICDDVKKALEQAGDDRLVYKILVISL